METWGARRDSESHFGSSDAQTQSTDDEAELKEQPRADDIDEEEKADPPDWEKMKNCIEQNVITGRHLILLDASTLPKIGIHDFEHIKKIAAAARELIHLERPIQNFKTAMGDPMIAYMDAKRVRGSYMDHISYRAFLRKNRRWYKYCPMP